uniref:Domain X domain-containing protein n=1 Tax=Quercus lobata TaxID=97700 RepID=A0A7N2L2R4_QUELO
MASDAYSRRFLSLRHIRDQLPQELVNAYDKFQEQVDKYLSPVQARKALEKEEKRVEEEEEWKYAKCMVEDMMRLCMKVDAPIELVRKAVKMAGFTNNMGCPRPIKLLIALEDTDIIKWYAGVGRRWLDFFCCCHNFKMVKTVETYHLRLASDEPSCSCISYFCDRMDTFYYRVRLLQNHLTVNPSVEDKWVPGMGVIHEIFYIIGIGSGSCY